MLPKRDKYYKNHMNLDLTNAIFSALECCNVTNKRACEANAAGENSLFIFTVCVISIPLYHFKLAVVLPHLAIKKFFKAHFKKWRNRSF